MKGFLNKVQQKKGAPNATDGKPAGGESNVRVDISLPKTQRRYIVNSDIVHLPSFTSARHIITWRR